MSKCAADCECTRGCGYEWEVRLENDPWYKVTCQEHSENTHVGYVTMPDPFHVFQPKRYRVVSYENFERWSKLPMSRVEIKLACQDIIRLEYRKLDDTIDYYCRFHGFQHVLREYLTEYRVLCCDCSYGRYDGQNESLAKRDVRNHTRYHKGHRAFYLFDTIDRRGHYSARKSLVTRYLDGLKAIGTDGRLIPDKPIPAPF